MKIEPFKYIISGSFWCCFSLGLSVFAQTNTVNGVTGISGNFHPICRRLSYPDQGDSSLAILSSHNKRYTNMVAQLGYIDTTWATVDEVYNNLKAGLLVFPSGNYEVCSFCVSRITKRQDPVGPVCYKGNRIPKDQSHIIGYLFPGTLLEFTSVRMRKKGTEITMPLPNFWIKMQ